MKKIEAYYKQCLEEGANEYQVEESKKKSVSVHSIIGDIDILRKIAENFVEHYESRVKEGSTVAGKCMFVCDNRNIAFDFYKILKELRPEWVVEKKCPDILSQGVTISEDDLSEFAKEGFSQVGLFDLLSNYFSTSIQYFGTFAS